MIVAYALLVIENAIPLHIKKQKSVLSLRCERSYVGRDELSSKECHLGIVRIAQGERSHWLQVGVC